MRKFIIAGAAGVLITGSSASALAASAADCQALFDKADINRDGVLQSNEASLFLDAMTQAQVRPQDASKVSSSEFMTACQKDAFANINPALGTSQAAGSSATDSGQATSQAQQTTQADQSIASPAGFMVSNLIGANVTSPSGENIGEVKDVVLSPQGDATHVIIDIGDKDIEIERSKLDIAATESGMKIAFSGTQADLAQLPAVNTGAAQQETAGTAPAPSQEPTGTAQTTTTAQQPSTAQQPAAPEVSETIAAPEGFMASNLIGATVKNAQDENVGEIKDIVFSDQGEPTHVIIDIGDKDVEVEKSKLDIAASEDGLKILLNGTQADLAQLPAVNVGAPEQQTAATSSQPAQQPSTEPATTSEQAATEQPAQQTATAEQPAQQSTTTEQPAQQSTTAEQPAQQTATAEQPSTEPATTSEQAATEQPAQQTATAEQPAQQSTTTEQPAQQTATAEQPAQQTATAEQPSTEPATTSEQSATEQPAQQTATAEQPAQETTTAEQPATSEAPAETTASVEQPSTGEASQAQPAEEALAIPEGLMVSDLIGATIYSPNDEKLGEVNDLSLSSGAGQPPRVIIGVGGFFGIGEKDVAVDMARLKFTTTDDGLKIVLDATKQDLENLAANSPQ